jgi:hypothetical protein
MIRSFFLAIGIFALILGAESLVIDKVVLAPNQEATMQGFTERMATGQREVVPPEWAPWSLLSAGAVVILYSFTLPQKLKSA